MEQQSQNAQTELEINLANVAFSRASLYELLTKVVEVPTLELAEGLLNGDIQSKAEANVQWVNSRSGIFNDSLAMLKKFAEDHRELSATKLLEHLEEEYTRMFSVNNDLLIFLRETEYVLTEQKGEMEDSIAKAFAKDEYDSFDEKLPYNHLFNEFGYLEYLCNKEGEAWQEGRIPKAKLWRRREREFTLAHLEKWGEEFFVRLEETTEHGAYKAFASLGKIFMSLENGY